MWQEAAEIVVNLLLRHISIQVSQVGVEFDESVIWYGWVFAALVLCQDLTGKLERTQQGLRKSRDRALVSI